MTDSKIYTTLADIRSAHQCGTFDTTPLPVSTVLDSNGLDDALWVLGNAVQNNRICTLFAADCAERVLHIFEDDNPGDGRPRRAIEASRDQKSTEKDRTAAGAAAGDAARAAARDAERDARAAAWAAARAARAAARAAWADAGAAAGDAARAAAWDAAGADAGAAARGAAWAAAWDAAWDEQSARLRQYLEHGEAAANMPWPVKEGTHND